MLKVVDFMLTLARSAPRESSLAPFGAEIPP